MFVWCSSPLLPFRLLSVLLTCLPLDAADDKKEEIISTPVAVSMETDKDGTSLIGELFLGSVRGGAVVNSEFQIKNATNQTLEFDTLKSSCSCMDVKVVAGQLLPGEELVRPATLRVEVPAIRASKYVVARVQLSSKSKGNCVATLLITANIVRPIFVPSYTSSVFLTETETFEHWIALEVDETVPLSSVVTTSSVNTFAFEISRETPSSSKCRILIRGKRADALAEKSFALTISCRDEHRTVTESITFDFYDGAQIRVIPTHPVVQDGELAFKLYRRGGLKSNTLEFEIDGNRVSGFRCANLTQNIVDVRIPAELVTGKVKVSCELFSLVLPTGSNERSLP